MTVAVKNVGEAVEWSRSLLGDIDTLEPAPGMVELKLTDDLWLQLDDTGYPKIGGDSAIIRFETDNIDASGRSIHVTQLTHRAPPS